MRGLGLFVRSGSGDIWGTPTSRRDAGLENVDPNDEYPIVLLPTALAGIPPNCLAPENGNSGTDTETETDTDTEKRNAHASRRGVGNFRSAASPRGNRNFREQNG